MEISKAKESPQIHRLRRKLKKQMGKENKLVTREALNKMDKTNKYWLQRHEGERIPLKDKSITLFDENRHPAATKSKFINHLIKNLKLKAPSKSLSGRVTQ